jgi:NAD(P)-dependent dehydrogenase (short-subunit alcohol dehydrogenase family)
MAMMAGAFHRHRSSQLVRFASGLAPRCREISASANDGPGPLTGQVAWVVGGAGVIGRGICRGLLKAGATVVVNATSQTRLQQLHRDLNSPEKLLGVCGTMRPSGAETLVHDVMQMTNSRLNHVVAHSGVRWWADLPESENEQLMHRMSTLDMSPEEFGERASMLPILHYTAAKLLIPYLKDIPGSSYTFVTGRTKRRSIEAHVNLHGVWGLAAALREMHATTPLRVSEIRMNMTVNRPSHQRAEDPRERPLSAEIGELCAGIASNPSAEALDFHNLETQADISLLKAKFPCPDVVENLPTLWHWQRNKSDSCTAA